MSECVLIVDDDPVQRRLLENMAQKFGYTALTAESGDQALRILSASDGPRALSTGAAGLRRSGPGRSGGPPY